MPIAFVTYETPFAPCGGIAAVMRHLPGQVAKATGEFTCVITPYHHRIERTQALPAETLKTIELETPDGPLRFSLRRHDEEWPWFFIAPENQEFFAGYPHPYACGDRLLLDALAFGAAVPKALSLIRGKADWTLLLQDWEAATAVLAVGDIGPGWRKHLMLHNSYDHGVTVEDLLAVGLSPDAGGPWEKTVLRRALRLTNTEVFTVSRQFAADLFDETLQTRVMADHLQDVIAGRVQGVDNGPFAPVSVPDKALEAASGGDFQALRDWKAARRTEALAAMDRHIITRAEPVWADPSRFPHEDSPWYSRQSQNDEAPWFIMAGRDDPRQKGYDVAAAAVQDFLEDGGDARFIFTPIPGDEGLPGLRFLERLARCFPEKVIVLPFRWRDGYAAAMEGAAFGIMPSLYEPFGMANELYMHGCMGIGRATGGLLQQIVPAENLPSFTADAAARAKRWRKPDQEPTGLLFREARDLPTLVDDWDALNEAAYDPAGGRPDRVTERSIYPLFQSMVEQLRQAIQDACRLYTEDNDRYCRMLTAGIRHIQAEFSWEKAAAAYAKVIQQ